MSNVSRKAKFSGANGNREILIYPVQLTTSRIGNLLCVHDHNGHQLGDYLDGLLSANILQTADKVWADG